MRYKTYLISILFLLSNSLSAQDKLNEYIELASKNNPGLQAKYFKYLAALEVVPQVGSLPDPQLGFGYFIQPIETRSGPQEMKISMKQMFPWFGSLQAREDVQVQMAKAKFEEFESSRVKLCYEVKSSYYKLYFLKKAAQITADNITILTSLKNLVSIKVASGLGSAVDELRTEMEKAELINQRELLADQLETGILTFHNLLNTNDLAIEIPDSISDTELKWNKSVILDTIRSNNHHLRSLDYAIASFKQKESVAQKSGLPDLSIGIDYFFIGKNNNAMQTGKDAIMFPNIGISVPLFRSKHNARSKEAELNTQAILSTKNERLNDLESEFEHANQDYQDAERRITLYESQLSLAKQGARLLETAYTSEDKGFDEILRMERRALVYSLNLEKARIDKLSAIAFITYLMGK